MGDSDSCEEPVATLSGLSSLEVPVSCDFARRRVRFCTQVFVLDLECVSQVSTVLSPECELVRKKNMSLNDGENKLFGMGR